MVFKHPERRQGPQKAAEAAAALVHKGSWWQLWGFNLLWKRTAAVGLRGLSGLGQV